MKRKRSAVDQDKTDSATAQSALDRIKEAESEARMIISEARDQRSRDIVAEAHKEAAVLKEKAMGEARNEGEKIKRAIIAEAEKEVRAIAEQTEERTRLLRAGAEARLDETVKKTAVKISEYLRDQTR